MHLLLILVILLQILLPLDANSSCQLKEFHCLKPHLFMVCTNIKGNDTGWALHKCDTGEICIEGADFPCIDRSNFYYHEFPQCAGPGKRPGSTSYMYYECVEHHRYWWKPILRLCRKGETFNPHTRMCERGCMCPRTDKTKVLVSAKEVQSKHLLASKNQIPTDETNVKPPMNQQTIIEKQSGTSDNKIQMRETGNFKYRNEQQRRSNTEGAVHKSSKDEFPSSVQIPSPTHTEDWSKMTDKNSNKPIYSLLSQNRRKRGTTAKETQNSSSNYAYSQRTRRQVSPSYDTLNYVRQLKNTPNLGYNPRQPQNTFYDYQGGSNQYIYQTPLSDNIASAPPQNSNYNSQGIPSQLTHSSSPFDSTPYHTFDDSTKLTYTPNVAYPPRYSQNNLYGNQNYIPSVYKRQGASIQRTYSTPSPDNIPTPPPLDTRCELTPLKRKSKSRNPPLKPKNVVQNPPKQPQNTVHNSMRGTNQQMYPSPFLNNIPSPPAHDTLGSITQLNNAPSPVNPLGQSYKGQGGPSQQLSRIPPIYNTPYVPSPYTPNSEYPLGQAQNYHYNSQVGFWQQPYQFPFPVPPDNTPVDLIQLMDPSNNEYPFGQPQNTISDYQGGPSQQVYSTPPYNYIPSVPSEYFPNQFQGYPNGQIYPTIPSGYTPSNVYPLPTYHPSYSFPPSFPMNVPTGSSVLLQFLTSTPKNTKSTSSVTSAVSGSTTPVPTPTLITATPPVTTSSKTIFTPSTSATTLSIVSPKYTLLSTTQKSKPTIVYQIPSTTTTTQPNTTVTTITIQPRSTTVTTTTTRSSPPVTTTTTQRTTKASTTTIKATTRHYTSRGIHQLGIWAEISGLNDSKMFSKLTNAKKGQPIT